MEVKDLGSGERRGKRREELGWDCRMRGGEALLCEGDVRRRRRQMLVQKVDRLFSTVTRFSNFIVPNYFWLIQLFVGKLQRPSEHALKM